MNGWQAKDGKPSMTAAARVQLPASPSIHHRKNIEGVGYLLGDKGVKVGGGAKSVALEGQDSQRQNLEFTSNQMPGGPQAEQER